MSSQPDFPLEQPTVVNSTAKYYYPVFAFELSGLGWIGMITAIALQSDRGLIFGYCALACLSLAAVISIVGFFRTQDRKQRWLCILAALFAISPFILYFLLIHVLLPFMLSGIAGPN